MADTGMIIRILGRLDLPLPVVGTTSSSSTLYVARPAMRISAQSLSTMGRGLAAARRYSSSGCSTSDSSDSAAAALPAAAAAAVAVEALEGSFEGSLGTAATWLSVPALLWRAWPLCMVRFESREKGREKEWLSTVGDLILFFQALQRRSRVRFRATRSFFCSSLL